ncbi:MAG: stage II sporulation protein M [Pyrinomonadaceae bacterium]
MNRFVNEHRENWKRLEKLLTEIDRVNGVRSLPRIELRELGELYRRAASDLAIARAESRDPKLVNYLNTLVIRAHGVVYRADSKGANIIWNFFANEFPNTFRETFRFSFFSFSIFTGCAIFAFLVCYNDLHFADILGLESIRTAASSDDKWWLSLNDANPVGAAEILTNNILVSIFAFVWGAFFCIGAVWVLANNGIMIGGVLGVCFKVNPAFGNSLVEFMVGHGVIELSCIFISGGAGMLIGYALINPGDLSRSDALKVAGVKAARLVFGIACLLVIAGLIEGFLSPSPIKPVFKYGTGILTGIALYLYLSMAGRKTENNVETSAKRILKAA